MSIELLIARYGLAAVFLGAGIEGETMVITGGVLAHNGLLPVAGVAIAAAAGSFVADQAFFAFGRYFREHPRVKRAEARPAFAKALAAFERHPTVFVFGFRFLYGLRTVAPMAIGTTAIRTRNFAALNLLAAAVWACLFTGIGYVPTGSNGCSGESNRPSRWCLGCWPWPRWLWWGCTFGGVGRRPDPHCHPGLGPGSNARQALRQPIEHRPSG
ncbi:DedA family protein [Sphingomonas sp. PB4P5]|uniref:DedA family protein n=1 Tax=Parasphingomonas puruogangriensis TaxID=3096155 RepID=UPI002FC5A5B5